MHIPYTYFSSFRWEIMQYIIPAEIKTEFLYKIIRYFLFNSAFYSEQLFYFWSIMIVFIPFTFSHSTLSITTLSTLPFFRCITFLLSALDVTSVAYFLPQVERFLPSSILLLSSPRSSGVHHCTLRSHVRGFFPPGMYLKSIHCKKIFLWNFRQSNSVTLSEFP